MDMTNPTIQARYDTLVCDNAARMAAAYKGDADAILLAAKSMGLSENDLDLNPNLELNLRRACASTTDEDLIPHRNGYILDEGIYECIKDLMRKIYGF